MQPALPIRIAHQPHQIALPVRGEACRFFDGFGCRLESTARLCAKRVRIDQAIHLPDLSPSRHRPKLEYIDTPHLAGRIARG